MPTNNEDRYSQWSLVINNPLDNSSGLSCKSILETLNGIYPFIAVIYHDDDIKDDGTPKTPHYHLILESKRTRKSTLIKSLSKVLNIPENCISSKEIINFRKAVRYITHIDYEDKTFYPMWLIETNDKVYLDSFFKEQVTNVCAEKLIEVVRQERTTSKIILKIGLEEYKKWAIVIRDLQKELL